MGKIIKVNNLIQSNGVADYKGLDLAKIVAGSQLYPHDSNVAYFEYEDETVVSEGDIQTVTLATYETNKLKHEEFLKTIVSPKEKVELLELEIAKIKTHLGLV